MIVDLINAFYACKETENVLEVVAAIDWAANMAISSIIMTTAAVVDLIRYY